MAKINLDLTKVQPESSSLFSKVPAGDYLVSVAHSAFKETSSGGAGLIVGYMIEAGDHKGKMIQDFINIKNSNEKAVEIGLGRLRLICDLQARKSYKLVEDKDLIDRAQFMITTVLEDSEYNGQPTQNVKIKKLFKADNSMVAQSTMQPASEAKKEMAKEQPAKEESKLPWE